MNPILASTLNPIIANPTLSGHALLSITLKTGTNTVNHGLGRLMQGFYITDVDAAVVPYRSQPMNASTLTLTCSAPVTINLWVY